MTPTRKPGDRLKRPARAVVAQRSRSRSATACGVIQPAQTLYRAESGPGPRRRRQAGAAEPPGARRTRRVHLRRSGHRGAPSLSSGQARRDSRNRVAAAGEGYKTWNSCIVPVRERRPRAGRVEPPGADERARRTSRRPSPADASSKRCQPVVERLRVVQAEVLDVESPTGRTARAMCSEDLAQRRRIGARKDPLADPRRSAAPAGCGR